mmetsp:Transcript_26201/g.87776  ORF Transcript_26201/g.87776 Transcript_26201/m.87776 type:complete len:131 (-) Transcript_26201:598-990(-)
MSAPDGIPPDGGYPMGPGGIDVEQMKQQQQQQKQAEEAREEMLMQLLTADARARLARLAMVKADKARRVEDTVIRMARAGQLRGQVDEGMVIRILEQVGGMDSEVKAKKIVFNRRRYDDDDDDDDDDDEY